MKRHKYSKTISLGLAQKPNISHNQEPPRTAEWGASTSGVPLGPQTTTHIGHNEEKIALVLSTRAIFSSL